MNPRLQRLIITIAVGCFFISSLSQPYLLFGYHDISNTGTRLLVNIVFSIFIMHEIWQLSRRPTSSLDHSNVQQQKKGVHTWMHLS